MFVCLALLVPAASSGQTCTTIQSGLLRTESGATIEVGFSDWGYNYQAHMFNGMYCDSYENADWCQPYADVELEMKWNDAWLGNQDCDGDGLLDRHYGFVSYRGSGAWLTNHQKGTYLDTKGKKQRWLYFSKIVAAPADATLVSGVWYAADGSEIGPAIWEDFAIISRRTTTRAPGNMGRSM